MDKTVLVVDDSKVSRLMLINFLKQLDPEWRVLQAEDGKQAAGLALAHRPSFVIMDVNMPIMSGIEAASIIAPELSATTIVLLSATEQDPEEEGIASLGVQFLQKPISETLVRTAIGYWQDSQ